MLKDKLPIFLINTLLLYIPLLALVDGWNYGRRNELILVGLGNLRFLQVNHTHSQQVKMDEIAKNMIPNADSAERNTKAHCDIHKERYRSRVYFDMEKMLPHVAHLQKTLHVYNLRDFFSVMVKKPDKR
jgi:hypothetical protein